MLNTPPIITLTTDFGYKDPFVGIMKGVVLKINPLAKIVDITHDISPHNIREAALTIGMSFSYFPPKTIHVVVVDPAVGSGRRPILVVTDHHYFIGPDNGVFSMVYNSGSETMEVINITAGHYFIQSKGSTFHGRDIFAPTAAWLTKGVSITNFGDHIDDYVSLPIPTPALPTRNTLEGEVIYTDRFGNAITNIKSEDISKLERSTIGGKLKVVLKGKQVPLVDYYSQAEDKGLYSLINSFGYIELFIYRGNASSTFNINIGDRVEVVLSP